METTQTIDINSEEFSVEALEERFEMEVLAGEPTPDWVCTCEIDPN